MNTNNTNNTKGIIRPDKTIIHPSAIVDSKAKLQKGVIIGMGSIIMDGSVVSGYSMVAAGSLVTPGKKIPKGELWAGSPAKKMRNLTTTELQMIETSAKRYIELGKAAKSGVSSGPFSHFSTKQVPEKSQISSR